MPSIEISQLEISYGSFRAVQDASFEAEEGEMLGLLGPSGSGKTTILRSVAGLEDVTAGRIIIGGKCIVSPAEGIYTKPEDRNLGMVFQSYAIWPHMTVEENIGFPLKVRNNTAAEIAREVARVLEIVDLADMGKRPATDLSGGQQQRVAIARALVFDPKVLLLDEPLSNVDAKLRVQMGQEIRRIQQQAGVTALYVTHDQSEALAMCDRIVVLDHGRIQQIDTPVRIYDRPQTPFVGWFIGKASFLRVRIIAMSDDGSDRVATVALGSGDYSVQARIGAGAVGIGDMVFLLVRPEDVHVQEEGNPSITATVRESSYFGDHYYCVAEFDGMKFGFMNDRRQSYGIGSRVGLTIRQNSTIGFPFNAEAEALEARMAQPEREI
jgi:iron(III) transport system ATP-binding protein